MLRLSLPGCLRRLLLLHGLSVRSSSSGEFFTLFGLVTLSDLRFFISFRTLDKREAELNAIGQGRREGFVDEKPQHESEKA